MRICRVTLDLAYEDEAEGAPKTERTLRNLIEKVLDPALGEYMSCSTGALLRHIDFPDPSKKAAVDEVMAWHRHADQQLALLDVERFAVTRATTAPVPVTRVITRARKWR